ncbi:VWFA domain-containing protein OS=Streptomyces fumanus OX=67302 GN=GCM10018772_24770 PE=4 SV=1 [Streptomyces fumanus]
MPYTAEISRTNPGCFIFLVDQSASMSDLMGAGEVAQQRAEVVSDAINRLLTELSVECAKEEGVRDYFHVAVIGYGHNHVGSAFQGALAGRDLVPLSEVANNPARVESRTKKVPDGAGGLVGAAVQFPVWMDPVTNGGTPMTRALGYADSLVANWVEAHPSGFPPIVLNLTDGESTDGDPTSAAIALASYATADGAVLLFNLHVSGSGGTPGHLPGQRGGAAGHVRPAAVPDVQRAAQPHALLRGLAGAPGQRDHPGLRLQRRDMTSIVEFLDIGTRATELR